MLLPVQPMTGTSVLSVDQLKVHYPVRVGGLLRGIYRPLKAVDGVSFDLQQGQTLGIVGESGCGKSTLGRAALYLSEPTAGSVEWHGEPLVQLSPEELRIKRRDFQMVFQDPSSSLNPRMTVYDIVAEPLRSFHPELSEQEIGNRVEEALTRVDMLPNMMMRFPHEFSGGQCQRISIARAIILRPKLLVLDEPVSALDVSVQAQIINLLKELQKDLKLSYLFISHDLSIVRYICDRIMVMYLGKTVETGSRADIFTNPQHPYTKTLIAAIPEPDPTRHTQAGTEMVTGELPSPLDQPVGCSLNMRCLYATERCFSDEPPLEMLNEGHWAACHHWAEIANK